MYRIFIHPETVESVWQINEEMKKKVGGKMPTQSSSRYEPKTQSLIDTFKNIGWKESTLQRRFKNLTDKMIHNDDVQNDELLREFANIWYEEHGYNTSITKTLMTMGLHATAAKKADAAISPMIDTCYSDSQIIQIAIQYLLGYYAPITTQDVTHFYKPEIINEWIPYYTNKGIKIPVMNLDKNCSINIHSELDNIIHNAFSKPNHILYFHTTSWKYCKRIMNDLNHLSGQPCLDFGVRPSFYMSETLRQALEWGNTRRNNFFNEIGTIVFSIPKRLPENIRYKKIHGDEWKTVMIKSRTCSSKGIPEDHNIPELDGYDLVYGNMLANSRAVKDDTLAEPVPHRPPKKQLASKTIEGDIFLKKHIIGCIFFSKI